MLSDLKKRIPHHTFILFVFGILLLLPSCEKETKESFTVDFSFEYVDDNRVKFVNLSEGEYYSLDWDFANGETLIQQIKAKHILFIILKRVITNVTLTVLDYTGNKKTMLKPLALPKRI